MGYKFNPFTGNLDEVGAGGGGGTPGGSDTQIQFNDAGSFGGDVDLTWNKTTNVMTLKGDLTLDDNVAGSVTTLQTITPTQNNTISLPNATGTVALVAGSSGQPVYNNAGAYAGLSTATIGATGNISLSLNGASGVAPVAVTGSWFVGTTPQVLIQPSNVGTAGAWSASGTGIGVNAASTFSGNLLDLQVNGTSRFKVEANNTRVLANGYYLDTTIGYYLQDGVGGIFNASGPKIISTASLSWVNSTNANSGTTDLTLFRDAANTLAQRNGGTSASPVAQTFRLYNFSVNPASDYERAFLRWSSNVLEIGTEGAGTGSAKPVRITAATLKLPNLPTYADNAAATTGGLVAGDVYKTASGELRITV